MRLVDTFKASLDTHLFRLYRRYLYSRYKATDELAQAEVVHGKAKESLLKMTDKFRQNMKYFDPGDQLAVEIENYELKSPVGIAAGFDKNCEVLRPTSYVFGFVNPGSVLKNPNIGNPQRPKSEGTVRIVVDDERKAIINAQGYPHKGLDYTISNLRKFMGGSRGNAKILLNFSGITDIYTEDAVLDSCKEILVRSAPYIDFGFYENSGHMVTLGNTRSVDTKSTRLCRNFAREVAGESGKPLFPYMLKMVEDVHGAFPDITIVACGGIFSGQDAWKAYEKGATLLSLYTALTFYGFGIVRDIHDVLKRKLGSETLQGFIEKRDGRVR